MNADLNIRVELYFQREYWQTQAMKLGSDVMEPDNVILFYRLLIGRIKIN